MASVNRDMIVMSRDVEGPVNQWPAVLSQCHWGDGQAHLQMLSNLAEQTGMGIPGGMLGELVVRCTCRHVSLWNVGATVHCISHSCMMNACIQAMHMDRGYTFPCLFHILGYWYYRGAVCNMKCSMWNEQRNSTPCPYVYICRLWKRQTCISTPYKYTSIHVPECACACS